MQHKLLAWGVERPLAPWGASPFGNSVLFRVRGEGLALQQLQLENNRGANRLFRSSISVQLVKGDLPSAGDSHIHFSNLHFHLHSMLNFVRVGNST